MLGDPSAPQNKNYPQEVSESFQLLSPLLLVLDTDLNPTAASSFAFFSHQHLLTDLGFGSTKGLLSKGCHHIARKGISLIKGNGVRANQQLAQFCFCYSLLHNPTVHRQSISVLFFHHKPCWENTEPNLRLFTLKWLSGKTNYTQNLHTRSILKAHIVYFVLFWFHREKHKEHN